MNRFERAIAIEMASEALALASGREVGTNIVAQRAVGMLTRHQLAVDKATEECAALLSMSDPLKEYLADANYPLAAEIIVRDVIAAYEHALENR